MANLPRLCPLLGLLLLCGCGAIDVPAVNDDSTYPAQALVATTGGAPAAGSGQRGATRINRSADGLFYVEALVNGEPVRFVVDSGSSLVVLTRADAERSDVGTGSRSARLQTAGGVTAMRHATIKTMHLAGRSLAGVEAAIIDDSIEVSLLGQSALSQIDRIEIDRQRLTFH